LETLHLGNNVLIGGRSILWAVHSHIWIENNVITGPEIVVMGGDHSTKLRGQYMCDVGDGDKQCADDQDVHIAEDVWIGARAIVLKGVVVARGAVIGAGSVVTRSVSPYSIVAGNPARVIRFRGSIEEIMEHEKRLYSIGRLMTEAEIGSAIEAGCRR
jgi:maltose O-acetyltransferase